MRRRHFGQAGHGHDVATDHDNKLGASRQTHFSYVHGVAGGRTQQFGVCRKRVLGFGNTNRVMPITLLLQFLDLSAYFGVR